MSWVPLIANFFAGLALVAVWVRLAKDVKHALLAIIVLTLAVPVASIGMIGMEHILHALLATLLAWLGARLINQEAAPAVHQLLAIAALAALATAARYESLALVGAIMLLALTQRRWSILLAVFLPAVIVVLGFGLIWVHAGGWWLPNSLLAKAPGVGGHSLAWRLTQVIESISYNARTRAGWIMAAFAAAL